MKCSGTLLSFSSQTSSNKLVSSKIQNMISKLIFLPPSRVYSAQVQHSSPLFWFAHSLLLKTLYPQNWWVLITFISKESFYVSEWFVLACSYFSKQDLFLPPVHSFFWWFQSRDFLRSLSFQVTTWLIILLSCKRSNSRVIIFPS